MLKGITKLAQKNEWIVILFVDLVPDHRVKLTCQFVQSGALAVARFCLQDRQAYFQSIFQNLADARAGDRAGIPPRWDQLGANNAGESHF
jgi:hypothetical protein